MYCSSCGSAVTPGLSYCNRCGAELTAKKSGSQNTPQLPEYLVWSIVAVSVGGLGVLIGLMAVMKNELHLANGLIVLFSLLSFLLLLAAESIFIWLLLSSQRRAQSREKDAADLTQLKGSAAKELGEGHERLLTEPPALRLPNTRRARSSRSTANGKRNDR